MVCPGVTGGSAEPRPCGRGDSGDLRTDDSKSATLGYRSAHSGEDLFPDRTIDLHLPLALLIGGAVVHVAAAIFKSVGCCGAYHVFTSTLRATAMTLVLGPAVMMVGLFIAAKFRGINFGNVYVAAMKLAAIAIAPGAVGALIAPLTGVIPFVGPIALLGVEFALYFALVGAMFKLDEDDTWYCVCVFFVLSVGLYFAMKALPWGL